MPFVVHIALSRLLPQLCLQLDYRRRPSAQDLLQHPFVARKLDTTTSSPFLSRTPTITGLFR